MALLQSSNPVPRDRRIPHECWFMCERAWACGMKITHEIMSNGELVRLPSHRKDFVNQ